jgi:chromosome segregation ATPase
MLCFLLLAFGGAPALANGQGRLESFVSDTEALFQTAIQDVGASNSDAAKSISSISSLPSRIRAIESEMKKSSGELANALKDLDKTLAAQSSCTLPKRSQVSIAVLRLERVEENTKALQKNLTELSSKLKRMNAELAERDLFYASANLTAYLENISELKKWLRSDKVAGLTSELVARHPSCAGKVVASGLGMEISPEEIAQSDAPISEEAKVLVDIHVRNNSTAPPQVDVAPASNQYY